MDRTTAPNHSCGLYLDRRAGMDADAMRSWQQYWGSLRLRRIAVFAAIPVTIPIWIAGGAAVGFLTTALAFGFAVRALRLWPCPRCGDPFIGMRWSFFPERCSSCGLADFASPEFVRRPDFVRSPTARTLPHKLRRFVAGAEIAGGAAVIALTPFLGALPLWYRLALESVGAIGLAAGIWLWRDDPRGYHWSRVLQALQVFRIWIPPVAFLASAGPHLDLFVGAQGPRVRAGFMGELTLLWGTTGPTWVGVNLLAAAWLMILLDARSSRTLTPPPAARFDVWWSEPNPEPTQENGLPRHEPASDSPHN